MNYALAEPTELKAARNRVSYLARKGSRVKITEVQINRTLAQNSYLHLIVAAFGANFGYNLEESKMIYKQINSSIYYYKKKGRTFIRSSSDLNKEEMMISIDKFMQASAEAGYELPKSDDREWLLQIENDVERNRRYL